MRDSIPIPDCFTVNAYSGVMCKPLFKLQQFILLLITASKYYLPAPTFFGGLTGLFIAFYGVFAAMYALLLLALVVGYAFAWVGHFSLKK